MLNVRSPSPDLTARALIRDAAVRLFGSQGYDATSVRQIADAAGVSAALVIHHFGSKAALRTECDQFIADEVVGRKSELATAPDMVETMQRWLADIDSNRVHLDYLARMLTDGSEQGLALFEQLVERTEHMLEAETGAGRVRPSLDPRMRAVIVATHGLMPLLLEKQLAHALGDVSLTPAVIARMTVPTLELYTHGLYSSTAVLDAATEAVSRSAGPTTPARKEGIDDAGH